MRHLKIALIVVFTLIVNVSNAQPAWRAKLFLHFLDSNNKIVTDTVWFGCDSLGDIGYQPGLDRIDTNLKYNHVYSSDDLIKTQYKTPCANLKQNIIGYHKGESTFKFYAVGNPVSISWDTMDFKYFDTTYRLNYVAIKSINGDIRSIDQQLYIIALDNYTNFGGHYSYKGFKIYNDSLRIYLASLSSACSYSDHIFEFVININMGWLNLGLVDQTTSNISYKIFPNPFNEVIKFDQTNSAKKISSVRIYNVDGKLELEQKDIANLSEIETTSFRSSIYIIYFYDDNSNQILSPVKLIKL